VGARAPRRAAAQGPFGLPPPHGRSCPPRCRGDCPIGYVCRRYAEGATLLDLCTPFGDVYCQPCQVGADCPKPNDQCTDISGATFCTADCSQTGACPPGYDCRDVPAAQTADGRLEGGTAERGAAGGADGGGGGVVFRQGLPSGGICPGCVDKDGDQYGIGADCLGPDCDDNDSNVTTPTTTLHCGVCGRACTNAHGTT